MATPVIKISFRLISIVLFSLSTLLALSSTGYGANEIETYQKIKLEKMYNAVKWKTESKSHDWVCTNKNKNSGFAFSSVGDHSEKCVCKTCDAVCSGSAGIMGSVSVNSGCEERKYPKCFKFGDDRAAYRAWSKEKSRQATYIRNAEKERGEIVTEYARKVIPQGTFDINELTWTWAYDDVTEQMKPNVDEVRDIIRYLIEDDNYHAVRTLSFANTDLSMFVELMVELFATNQEFTSINLSNCNLNEQGLKRMLEVLQHNQVVTEIDVTRNAVVPEILKQFKALEARNIRNVDEGLIAAAQNPKTSAKSLQSIVAHPRTTATILAAVAANTNADAETLMAIVRSLVVDKSVLDIVAQNPNANETVHTAVTQHAANTKVEL